MGHGLRIQTHRTGLAEAGQGTGQAAVPAQSPWALLLRWADLRSSAAVTRAPRADKGWENRKAMTRYPGPAPGHRMRSPAAANTAT